MEKFFLVIIVLYLVYVFFKTRKKREDISEYMNFSGEKEKEIKMREVKDYEKHILAAVVAVMMEGKKYRIRSVFSGDVDEKNSSWKTAGRQDSMLSGLLLRKK